MALHNHIDMKKLTFFLLLAGLGLLPLHAANLLLNGDFTDSLGHWYGDGRTPAEYAQDNAQLTPDDFNNKGVIMPLKDMNWLKIAQDFQGNINGGTISVTYKLSPNFAFSDIPENYKNVPNKIGYNGWKPFGIKPGMWMLFISDFGSAHGTYYSIKPKAGTAPQTIRCKITKLTPHEDKTITLAFPPGTGTVVILNVSVEGEGSAANDPDAIPSL